MKAACLSGARFDGEAGFNGEDCNLDMRPRQIAVLGATGSVGQSTLGLVRDVNCAASGRAEEGPISIEVLTANQDVAGLAALSREFRPDRAVIADAGRLGDLKAALAGTGVEPAAGASALTEAGGGDADWVMAAIVGAAGLAPTMAAVKRGACVALANKECLVSAGPLFLAEVAKSGANLLSADSEHNAIFQMFDFERPETIDTITLTASGGPFRTWKSEDLKDITPAQAMAHPTWDMGAKISIDSATLMNKGLEVIEAFYLFPVEERQIEVVIHPQSIVHSFVSYKDGSVLAQMATPDMSIPIANTLAWPGRIKTSAPKLDLARMGTLTFEPPDHDRFPALGLARSALQTGGVAPTILNAANEVAVAEFLGGRLGFGEIVEVVEETMSEMSRSSSGDLSSDLPADLEGVIDIDHAARKHAAKQIRDMAVA